VNYSCDYPLQVLIPPRTERIIFIYNNDTTFSTIGEKENFTERCKGDIICQWDDDIALPNHLNNVNKYFTDETNIPSLEKMVYFIMNPYYCYYFVGNSGIVFKEISLESYRRTSFENAGMIHIENLNKYEW
jgi:hypothetical protein